MRFSQQLVGLGGGITAALASLLIGGLAQAQPAENTITISPGFSPNPLEFRKVGSGSVPVRDLVGKSDTPTGECTGFSDSAPDYTLVLTSFFNSLSLELRSSEDTAIAIKGPGGVWCNDDFKGKHPGVTGQWLAGTYRIWVSSYAKNRSPSYTLRLTEQR